MDAPWTQSVLNQDTQRHNPGYGDGIPEAVVGRDGWIRHAGSPDAVPVSFLLSERRSTGA
jgi:hypothetical protein